MIFYFQSAALVSCSGNFCVIQQTTRGKKICQAVMILNILLQSHDVRRHPKRYPRLGRDKNS